MHIRQKGVKLMLSEAVKSVVEDSAGLTVTLSSGDIRADILIMAVGVRPESGVAKAANLATNERGGIIVNEYMQTSDEDIYAVGDAVEIVDFVTGQKAMIPLAGPANKQGRIAADNICGRKSKFNGTQGSAILKVFDLTVATTGINEKAAKRLGLDYDKSFTYSAHHASYYPGALNMSIKTVFEKGSGRILGAQVVGFEGSDKRCDVIATAIRAGMTAFDLAELELCYAPPYSSAKDPVNMAGFVIENLIEGKVRQFHWHDVDGLLRDGSVTLLDVRTAIEYEYGGKIDGFINIPLDELRSRMGELDRAKTVYVTCQMGLRGYVAARMLSQHGFEVYNLSGGYRLYHSVFSKGAPQDIIGMNPETQLPASLPAKGEIPLQCIKIDACGLQCPGPIVKLAEAMKEAHVGDVLEISTTDPAFASDIEGYCRRTHNEFLGMSGEKGVNVARIKKSDGSDAKNQSAAPAFDGKNFIVFSGDLDKAIASFIMANASAALGRNVSMFFTFWGLSILRKPQKVRTQKDFISKMFGAMMPRGSLKLGLSKMNMGGMGAKMIRSVMRDKNVDSLEDLIALAQKNGVELIACSMSMDVMGIKQEELIDGVKIGGAAAMLAHAEESDMSLFI